jgi:hypothetical protein
VVGCAGLVAAGDRVERLTGRWLAEGIDYWLVDVIRGRPR